MNNEDFQEVIKNRIINIQHVLDIKGAEYTTSSNSDRLSNFKDISIFNNTPITDVLWSLSSKHLWSVINLVKHPRGREKCFISEKIGDLINYLILLEAMLYEINE